MLPVIQAHDLTKVYRTYVKQEGFWGAVRGLIKRDYRETIAVDHVSLQINEGELVGFLGPNGAGKTTTLKMLAGLLEPTSGSASVLGYTPWQRRNEFRRSFSIVLGQKNQLWWDLPAAESLELNRVIYGIEKKAAQAVIDELSEGLAVKGQLGVMVRELSLGERMKMELIAALLHRPKVLFLDEPTIGLDVISQQKVREFLRSYSTTQRITTLLTSHYMRDIEELCQRVIVIDRGKVFFDGPLQNIIDRFATHKILTLTGGRVREEIKLPEGAELVEKTAASLKLKIIRSRISQISQELLAVLQPDDITIEEVPIEELIRQLFTENRPATTPANQQS
jgi:ABC-2 type transport system ATP-binding protein